MTYSKQTWADSNPSYPVSASRMSHIEDGIEAAVAWAPISNGSDDTAALNALFAAFPDKQIRLRPGQNYKVNGYLSPTSGSDIDGRGTTITQLASLTPTIRLNGVTGVSIRNVNIVGKGTDYVNTSAVYSAAGIYITGASTDISIDGCTVVNCAGAGIAALGSSTARLKVRKCTLTGVGVAGGIINSTSNYSGGVVTADNMSSVIVEDCDISQFAQGVVTGDGFDFRVVNNDVHDIVGQHGLYFAGITRLVVANNLVRNCILLGMKVQTHTNGVDAIGVNIGNNVFTNNGSHGVLLTTGIPGNGIVKRAVVTDNVITGDGLGNGDGIQLNNADGVIVANNQCYAVRHGINLVTASRITIGANVINNCTDNGVFITDSTDVQVSQQRIIDVATASNASSRFGVMITTASGSTDKISIDKCTISDSTGTKMRYGIYVAGGTQTTMDFTGNVVTGAADYGVRLIAATSARSWRNNLLSGGLGSVLNPVPSSTVSPYGGPGSNALIGAIYEPALATANMTAMTTGVLWLHKVVLPDGGPVSTIWLQVGGAGVGLTAGQCFAGAYSSAGTLLGSSADQSTFLGSTGSKNIALSAATASLNPGDSIWVAILTNGATGPIIRGISGSGLGNINLSAAASRWATAGSGLTALPGTLPTLTASSAAQWVGVS